MMDSSHDTEPMMPSRPIEDDLPRNLTPIVPKNSIAGHALAAVVAIMTFLASLTAGGVMLVLSSAAEWQSDVAREMTIQVRPLPGRDIEADVARAAQIAQATEGVTDVRPYSKAESARLLEPWLGTGLSMEDLPIPRIVVVRTADDPRPDLAALRAALAAQVASASLDDHRGWVDRMRAMASTAIAGGIAILALVLAATVLSVAFATRGAMATNRHIVEVLHFIGAKNAFIAGQFQGHFLILGLQGGGVGGGAALVILAIAGLFGDWFLGTAASDQSAALFGTFSIGITGYIVVIGQVLLVAAVTAWTSRRVVNQTLNSFD
jgi:cell division transport system permease protein